MAFEVSSGRYLGWGGPIGLNRVVTVRHLGNGAPNAMWEWRSYHGHLTLIWDDSDRDLAMYVMEANQVPSTSPTLRISNEWPLLGEEVYWNTHTWDGGKGFGRGWIVAVDKDEPMITVDGYHHPGTSGSPVLRADGTLIGIVLGGTNWSCGAPARLFQEMNMAEQIDCLYRRDAFPAEMMVSPVIGGVR